MSFNMSICSICLNIGTLGEQRANYDKGVIANKRGRKKQNDSKSIELD